MHKRNSLSVKKQQSSKSASFSTRDILGLIDKLEKLNNTPFPESPLEKRKYLIFAYKTLADAASYYHQILTFPSADRAERNMEKDLLDNIVSVMHDVTMQVIYVIDSINGEGAYFE